MQTLDVKVADPKTKKEEIQKVQVIRMWEAGGARVYLHSSGIYGDKRGFPVQTESALDIIEDPKQYKRAIRWWETKGEELALEVYGELTDEPPDDEVEDAYYISYPVGDRPDEPGPGEDWMALGFKRRPDWWGAARVIEIGGQVFEMEEEEPDEIKKKPAKKSKKTKKAEKADDAEEKPEAQPEKTDTPKDALDF